MASNAKTLKTTGIIAGGMQTAVPENGPLNTQTDPAQAAKLAAGGADSGAAVSNPAVTRLYGDARQSMAAAGGRADPGVQTPIDPAMKVTNPVGTQTRQSMAAAKPASTVTAQPATAPQPRTPGNPAPAGGGAGGIISSAMSDGRTMVDPSAVNEPVKQEASGVTGTMRDVNADTDTVFGQLNKVLASDSPLLQQARAKAAAYANARGILNSSMAAQSGEEAAISQALPIAQQDAQTYFTQGRANQDTENVFKGKTADFENQQGLTDFQQQAQRAAQAEGSNQRLKEGEQGFQNNKVLQNAELENRTKVANIDAESRTRAASISASAQIESANISASTSKELAQLEMDNQKTMQSNDQNFRSSMASLDRDQQEKLAKMGIDANSKSQMLGLQQNTLVNFGNQQATILGSQMETEDKLRLLGNLNSIYSGSPFLPVNIDLNVFHPSGSTPGPNAPPPNTTGG
jgi:hypothetical protein